MEDLQLLFLIISILGLTNLLAILILPVNIIVLENISQLKDLEINQKVIIKGIVENHKIYSSTSTIKIREFSLKVQNSLIKSSLINKTACFEGIVDDYYNNKTIKISKKC